MPLIALLANPRSGARTPRSTLEAGLRRAGAEVISFDLDELDRVAASGCDRLVVAGGDGSIARVAALAAASGVPLGVIPAGTANDYARTMGLSQDLLAACHVAATSMTTKTVELAWMRDAAGEERPFVNAASAGLAVEAARHAREWKPRVGAAAYGLAAVRAGLTARPVEIGVSCDGEELYVGTAWQVIVASSGAFGGGSSIGVADSGDGRLDVTAIAAGPRRRLAAHAFGLRRGRIVSQRGVYHAKGLTAQVQVPPDTAFNVDGEVLPHGPAAFRVARRAFRLVVAPSSADAHE